MNKTLYFTNIFPSYRKELWENLFGLQKIEFHIFFSNKNLNGIRTTKIDSIFSKVEAQKMHQIQNYFIGGHLWWQTKVLKVLWSTNFKTAIFLGDMKILSNWIGILICRIRRKQVAFWTHGIYGNEKGLKKTTRLFFLSLADQLFLYENRAKRILLKHNFSEEKLHVVYNSINLKNQTKVYKKLLKKRQKKRECKPYNLIFFGRLTKIKKVHLLIAALASLNKKRISYKLKIVGDGPEKKYLKLLVKKFKSELYIEFVSATYDESQIGNLFFEADLLVSPGNVGLNAVHALSYGTPVLTHINFKNQMPEHETIKDNFNGCFHNENDSFNLELKIKEWFENHHKNISREKIRKRLIEKYNPVYQAKIFERVLLQNS